MKIVSILAALAAIAIVFNQKWLGELVFLFIFGCALFGFGDFVKDVALGQTTLTKSGRQAALRRYLQSLPEGFNPRYANLRSRGISHEDCVRRGEPPIRPDDYFERRMDRCLAEYKQMTCKKEENDAVSGD